VAGSAHKKVLVSRFDRETLRGFVQSPGGLTADQIELLTPGGELVKIPYSETKVVCFVRDFAAGETWRQHRAFSSRPKSAGLWVRLRFRDGDSLEGVLPNDLMQIDSSGFSLVPPDPTFQNQRIFVPRWALEHVQVLGVIGSPLRRRAGKKAEKKKEDQLEMFEDR